MTTTHRFRQSTHTHHLTIAHQVVEVDTAVVAVFEEVSLVVDPSDVLDGQKVLSCQGLGHGQVRMVVVQVLDELSQFC